MSAVATIGTGTTTTSTDASGTPPAPVQTLGENDFLQLLVTQMTSQDPMNPQSDTDFIAQMAQFSSLQQAQTTGSDISQMRQDQELMQANAMLGQTVTLPPGADGNPVSGVVSAVEINNGTPQLLVEANYTT